MSEKDTCIECGEMPTKEDPGLSGGVCFWCGYMSLSPGPIRETFRTMRIKSIERKKVST